MTGPTNITNRRALLNGLATVPLLTAAVPTSDASAVEVPIGDMIDRLNGADVAFKTFWQTLADLPPRSNKARWSDEVRITSDDLPMDYVTPVHQQLQKIATETFALNKRLILPDTKQRQLVVGAPINLKLGIQKDANGKVLRDPYGQPLRWHTRIEGNGCSLAPNFAGPALDFEPTGSWGEGDTASILQVRNLQFDLYAHPAAQAYRVGRQGMAWAPFNTYGLFEAIHIQNASQKAGTVVLPKAGGVDHSVRLEGGIYGVIFRDCRHRERAGMWFVVDDTTAGVFQGAFFFDNHEQAAGDAVFRPRRFTVKGKSTLDRNGTETLPVAEMRGLHNSSTQIYGSGERYEALGNAHIGDVFFRTGCQFDGPCASRGSAVVLPSPGEYAIDLASVGAGRLFNFFWNGRYIQNYRGAVLHTAATDNPRNIWNIVLDGGLIAGINNPTGAAVECEGGVKVRGTDFTASSLAQYMIVRNGEDWEFSNNSSSEYNVGSHNNVAQMVVIVGKSDRYKIVNNVMQAQFGVIKAVDTKGNAVPLPGATTIIDPNRRYV